MRAALQDLELERLTVYYPGARRYRLSEEIDVVPFAELAEPLPLSVEPNPI